MIDFLIIGGGIAGVSAAARLSHLGSVVLLEAEPGLAYHTSGRSAALYEPCYGSGAVVELTVASGEYFRSVPGLLSPRGMMVLARPDQAETFRKDVRSYSLDVIDVQVAAERVPVINTEVVSHAAWADHAWDIDTDRLIQNFASEARANGGVIETSAPVTAIRRDSSGWVVITSKGEFRTRLLVNAAGAWADDLAKMAGVPPLGLQPMRRSIARIPAPGGNDLRSWPMMFGAGESWYAKPDAGALIVSPAEEHPMDPHDAWADDMVLAEGLARYEEMVTEPVTRLISSWAGLRTFSPDRVLVIGRDKREPDFFWLAGQGGYGFQSSAAASQLTADLIGGRTSDLSAALVDALDPARFG
ncbi:FAD-binding oxidoreductase [Tabrizicola sp. J26]|uniref:NAD(P)/FAD-dependent oxidoreductase n=1 Tax=Alitabrizicola rongguiensis TaxID=2909234 RepID=UPI001F32F446|nr:FAD-binding oxidoreductase [Tabrizicola rongguiensis]MCF1710539.1 FAD-binding oxidoreductase [Tabrizicola rongguiensis]